MSDEEEDYMSEAFLNKLNDVRPSLIQNRAKKRQVDVSKKKEEYIKKQREERSGSSTEKLQESLKRPLDECNKGFQLLAKMGYKSGQALGKTTNDNEAASSAKRLIEPIGINIKLDRGGLGREAALKELAEKRKKLHLEHLRKSAKITTVSTDEYRQRHREIAEERFTQNSLRKCQKTCENLDVENGLEKPDIVWFWPERGVDAKTKDAQESDDDDDTDEEEEEEPDNYTNEEKLDMLISYLRTSYNFCFWCGTRYTDERDLSDNCPGETKDEH